MRVGILTIHCNYNYGALLQSYALQEFLRGLGHEVSIINYRPGYLESVEPKYHLFPSIHIRQYFRTNLRETPLLRKKYYKFRDFESLFSLTEVARKRDDICRIAEGFDYIIFGSDQIWCNMFNGNEDVWFGNIGTTRVKKVSYAASAGDANFTDKEISTIIPLLNQFKAIGVREEKLYNILRPLIDKLVPMTCVLDPSLMVPSSLWEKWYKPIRGDRYIVVRMARDYQGIYPMAEHLAKQLNCKIVNADVRSISFNSSYEVCPCSPSEFVSLIKNAQCVLTNSFHGTAFSIVTNTPFYTVRMGDNQDERSQDLLNALGLSDRMVDKGAEIDFRPISFNEVNQKLNTLRKKSQQFLVDNIE